MKASIASGCSKRPFSKAAGESKPEAYPQGYVEDFDEPRTTLADFFSILLADTMACRSDRQIRIKRQTDFRRATTPENTGA